MQKFAFVVLGFVFLASWATCSRPSPFLTDPTAEFESSGDALSQTSSVEQKDSVSPILVYEDKTGPALPKTFIIAGQPGVQSQRCADVPQAEMTTIRFRVAVPGEGSTTVDIVNGELLPRTGAKYTRGTGGPNCTKDMTRRFVWYQLVSNGS